MGVTRRSLLQFAAASVVPAPLFAQSIGPRIVSLDYGLASTLLSLGLPPVGISDLADWDRWVVEPPMPKSVVDIGSSFEVNFEILVTLKPDIILTTPYLDELLPKLQSVAKVVRLEVFTPSIGSILPAAIAATRKLAGELGRENEAEQFLARADAFFERCRSRLAGKNLPPVALVNFMDARHVRIYSSPGLFHNVLERIGVRNAWTRESNYWGFETIGIEDLSKITDPDARLIAFDPVPPDVLPKLAQSPLWNRLAFARPGHLSILPPALMFGMVNEAMRFAGLLTDLLEKEA
ncbi:iron siderophore-binding protein [Rhizobium leguminosarum bv. trifolii]|jgi:iron complex transport system substrate-binding protein|uniref:Iron siderophore-binding protein n=1 Tax=Rhizobium leguminosarum bv. trifolii TaxID=386 RepID=A0A1B8RJM0_RHILT|nr:iron-siderophore ABC transporter substrate-binding protein [Rhizobium leguminosarum]AOO87840.1 iron siderophore-binding protein [Rhizobium leguminosarum bv. trifolii]MBA8832418.1 iron complex transport system substrate-binding protein [Rhizobium leguminosarum]MBY5914509.1 iron-siderophore ABC transporter substrate-binding protein [Rhizobium leguminosarum]MDH6275039.1 ABC-type Fe3+-hydroxamate transport system substrate-binding protein [Rhizobium leguminosarum]MVO92524.1 ABC transporter subs